MQRSILFCAAVMVTALCAVGQPVAPLPVDGNTVALYPFEAGGGSFATDLAGGVAGVLGSSAGPSPTWGSPGAVPGSTSYLSFSGENWVSIPPPFQAAPNGVQNAFTIEMWFRSTASSFSLGSHLYRHRAHNRDVGILIDDQFVMHAWATPNPSVTFASPAFNDGQWHHVAFTSDACQLRLYIDGVRVGAQDRTSDVRWTSNFIREDIGDNPADGGTRGFPGDIDEVRISDIARYAPTLSVTRPFGPGSLNVSLTGGRPGDLYFVSSGKSGRGRSGKSGRHV